MLGFSPFVPVFWEIVIGAGLTYYLLTIAATFYKLYASRRSFSGKIHNTYPLPTSTQHINASISGQHVNSLPPVSILKPVNGVDALLRENLLSFINQDYPEFEIVIGVQSSNDPAIKLVDKLKEEHPSRDIKLVISSHAFGYNPKINNLYGMMNIARYEHMVISDSNVAVDRDYLKTNIEYFKDDTIGIVTNLMKGVGGTTAGALFENLHLNSFVIGNVSLLDLLNGKIVIGKSIFFRRSQFEKLGGLSKLRNYLAEDYLMGKLYKENGYRVVISPNLISTTNDSWTIRKFINRHTRWAQLRWNLNKGIYVGELLLNFSLLSLVYAVVSGFSYDASMVTALCWATKIIGDSLMNETLKTGLKFRQCLVAPLKDLLIGFLWIVPLVSRKTSWRGNSVRITRKTLLLPTN
jgi:ceramide glucosyltransferase